MAHRRYKPSKHNEPDFDLDLYLEEQARQGDFDHTYASQDEFEEPTTKRNLIAMGLFLVIPAVWFFSTLFGVNEEAIPTRFTTAQAPTINIEIPDIEIPDIEIPSISFPAEFATQTTSNLNISYTEYLEALNELGYLDDFGSSSSLRLYNNSVPVDYIDRLGKAGLLSTFGSSSISMLYQNEIPLSFLSELKEANLLDNFGGSSIIRLYRNEVPVSYLSEAQEAGVLNQFGSSSLSQLFRNDVPVSYLLTLREKGLLPNMSSSSIIAAYKLDGN